MDTRVTRPDVRRPNHYTMELDETMLLCVEEGLLTQVDRTQLTIEHHNGCDLRSGQFCQLRNEWLVTTYGSIEGASQAGFHPHDCTEDLSYLFTQMGRLLDALSQSRWIRANPTGRNMYDARDASKQLAKIKGEAAYREEQGKVDTSLMGKLDEETLARLDAEQQRLVGAAANGQKSLFDLVDKVEKTERQEAALPPMKATTGENVVVKLKPSAVKTPASGK
jgi:hypothetical protein